MLKSRKALLALALLVTASGCGHRGTTLAGDGGQSELRIGYTSPQGGPPSGPEGWAYKRGLMLPILKQQNISSIRFIPLPSGPNVNEALAAKAIDIAMCGDAPSITGHAAGIPAKVVAISSVGTNAYLYTAKNGPNRVEDLRGKAVGTRKGSIVGRYLLGVLAEKGLSRSVKVVQLQDSDAEAALQRGDIAAYAGSNGPIEELRGFKIIDQARDHPHLQGAGVTLVSEAFLATHPGFPAAWNTARAAGVRDLKSHLNEYYQGLAGHAKLKVELYEKLYPARQFAEDPFTPEGIDALNRTKAFLLGQGLLKRDFNIDGWLLRDGRPPVSEAAVASSHSTTIAAVPENHSK